MSEYTYYPGGLRSSKRVNGETTRFVYHESRIIAELGEDYGLKASSLFGSGILFREADSKTISYLTDGHGDVVGLSDAFGKVTNRKEYEPFGKERQPEATGFGKGILRELQREEADGADNPFGYCGEYLDEETGFIYLRARYYSPDTGRFISEDPIRDGLNWYVYCANNPILYIDPMGLWNPETDTSRSKEAQVALRYYTDIWDAANLKYHDAITDVDRAAAKSEMEDAHNNAENIREQDKDGKIKGTFYEVPLYRQHDQSLCWAYSQVMIKAYHDGRITQWQADYAAKQIAIAVHGSDNWDRGGWPTNGINSFGEGNAIPVNTAEDIVKALYNGPVYGYYSNAQTTLTNEIDAHMVVITGAISAENHPTLFTINNPWGYSEILTFDELMYSLPQDTQRMQLEFVIKPTRR